MTPAEIEAAAQSVRETFAKVVDSEKARVEALRAEKVIPHDKEPSK